MKKLVLSLMVALLAMGTAFAQEEAAETKAVDTDVKVGAILWGHWAYDLTEDAEPGIGAYGLDRAYLMVDKNIDETWSVSIKVEGNADQVGYAGTDATAGTPNGPTTAYGLFFKEFSLKGKTQAGPGMACVSFGLIETPYTVYTAKLNGDFWLNKDYVLLKTNEQGYDAGLGLGYKMGKMVDFYATVTHGDQYKNLNAMNGEDKNMQYAARLGVQPVEGLHISGFFQYDNNTAPKDEFQTGVGFPTTAYDDSKTTSNGYYGGGVAWKDKAFRVGANFIVETQQFGGEDGSEKNNWVLDTWANANLNQFIGMPVMLWASFDRYQDNSDVFTNKIGGGVGYVLGPKTQMAVYYNIENPEGAKATQTLSVNAATQF